MKRVAVYVDGFNLYHAIHDLNKPWLKWLDLSKVAQSLVREGEFLTTVNYFSAYATWLPRAFDRHREYVHALEAVGVKTCMGKFKHKPVQCRKCGAEWMKPEEKETDVNIAVKIVEDALLGKYERYILISADSDIRPAIETARRHQPKKEFFVAAPPKRFGSARDLSPKIELTSGRLGKCLFSREVFDNNGELRAERPREYDPPANEFI